MDTRSVGGRVRALRLRRKLSQVALASSAGFHRNTIVNVEKNGTSDVTTLSALATALDVTLDDLLGRRKPRRASAKTDLS